MWQSGFMKTKNMREMEKHWAEQREKAAKKAKVAAQPKRENTKQPAQSAEEGAEKA